MRLESVKTMILVMEPPKPFGALKDKGLQELSGIRSNILSDPKLRGLESAIQVRAFWLQDMSRYSI